MPNGKALQAGTSHNLGQNFAKSFDWSVKTKMAKNFIHIKTVGVFLLVPWWSNYGSWR
jgi:hypothetical protein